MDDLTLHVQPGEIYGFIGHNGAGRAPPPRAVGVPSLPGGEKRAAGGREKPNDFSGGPELHTGLPATSRGDSSRHGFGTKSIQYIAAQYGGTMDIKVVDNMFFLTVRFPLGRNRDKTA